ncbi:peptidoglycan recognition protein family protein [Tepidibacter formicigenes]|jgi:hypothetical protein|uniref:Uncharacterized protein n=1 Tax=Tepidibacter formicigenes DSM 15518 TaxID=1123349 RepID=A0A1M6TR29_9FIRM|nr:hypothetical protein [Tepidibacter formicigenes]SHK59363.1 hypothetical protein SAMN02744037_02656 [Tepidibacter formicigenes DSM 15518]
MKIIETNLAFRKSLKKMNKPSTIVSHHAAHSSATVDEIHRWHKENGWSELPMQQIQYKHYKRS